MAINSFPRYWGLFFAIVVLVVIVTFITIDNEEIEQKNSRKPRSIYKESLGKDSRFVDSNAIKTINNKIFSLEKTMENITSDMSAVKAGMEEMSEQNRNFRDTVIEQTGLMENFNAEVETLKKILSGHRELIGELEELATTEDHSFALSNETCGGVLVGQSGVIHFTSSGLSKLSPNIPLNCIWTIRASNRQSVKITPIIEKRPYSIYSAIPAASNDLYVVEVFTRNISDSEGNKLQTRLTKLNANVQQTFKGPIVFVIYTLIPNTAFCDRLQLHYEGKGKFIEKTTFFSHENIFLNSGNFGSSQIATRNDPRISDNNNVTYSWNFMTIVIANFSTKAHLEAKANNTLECLADKEISLNVITNIFDNTQITNINCCQESCDGWNSLVSYDSPFIVIVRKKFETSLNFNITWEAEKRYPTSSATEISNPYAYKCGGVVGGTSGSISYKPRVDYRNGERCIWAIAPQPGPRRSIEIEISSNGIESRNDRLYMMELTDINGTELVAPRINHFGRYGGTYHAHSRELYIVFYTDSTVVGQGFSLYWRSKGDLIKTGIDVKTSFSILKTGNGFITSLNARPPMVKSMYQVYIFTPITSSSSQTMGYQFQINQTQPDVNTCLQSDVSIYTDYNNGLMKKQYYANSSCAEHSDLGKMTFKNDDGMAIIVVKDNSPPSSPPVAMHISWREDDRIPDGSSYEIIEDNKCGGVITGEKGVLKFKVNEEYNNNEKCIWLLQTPNFTRISLSLLKDGFEECCDYILVNTIDPNDGSLRNDTKKINRANHTRIFEESVLVIVFRSDTSSRGNGFVLQFDGQGPINSPSKFRYQLRHRNEPRGEISYPDESEWEEPTSHEITDILVIASSIGAVNVTEVQPLSTHISLKSAVFKKENNECSYDSIAFYTSPGVNGWVTRKRLPEEKYKISCPQELVFPEKKKYFNTASPSFLAIYRTKPRSLEMDEDGQKIMEYGSQIELSYERSSSCGGVIIGDSGEISYKEDGMYSVNEKCVWLVHAPEAKKIEFKMEKSKFEECCDLVYISIFDENGDLTRVFDFRQGNLTSTIVDGPVAVVVFTSDHSVNGGGFNLQFSTSVNATEPFPVAYQVGHMHDLEERFSAPVKENEVIVAAFSKDPSSTQSMKTQVKVTSMRAQIDESCKSDELTVYNVFGRDEGLVPLKTFRALDAVKVSTRNVMRNSKMMNNTCSLLRNTDYGGCSIFYDCVDRPSNFALSMNKTAFIAVYKSVNASAGDLEFRGFILDSKTTTDIVIPSSRVATVAPTRLYGYGWGHDHRHSYRETTEPVPASSYYSFRRRIPATTPDYNY